jgi:TP901 family phage tail tape measure protein
MLNLKLAEAITELSIDRRRFDSGLATVIADLGRLKGMGAIPITIDRSQATSSLGLIRQQLDELQKAARISVTVGGSGGGGGGIRRGSGGGGGEAMVGLGQLQVSGLALQDRLVKAKEQSAARDAAAQEKIAARSQASALAQARATIGASSQAAMAQEKDAIKAADAATREAKKAGDATERAYDRSVKAADRAAAAQEKAAERAYQKYIKGEDRAAIAQFKAQEKAEARAAAAAARAAAGGGTLGRGAANFGMGALQGLGVSQFALNPQMMVGQMIGSGLKDAVGTAMDLESTFVGLQRVSGESATNIDKFKKSIFDIGKSQAGVSIKDLTDIAGAGAKAGITDKEGLAGLETFTRGMAKVRNSVQGIGTEQLANDMTRLLNLFHKGTDYVESFGSVLTRMDNVSTSSAGDIMDISKSLAGTFASLGMTIPQVMAFSSVLSDVGLTNQQGAGSFSQILRLMASQSEEMAGLIGVPVEKFQQAIRTNAMDALGMLIGKFRELNEVDPVKAQEFLVSLGFRGVKTAGALQQLSSMFEQVQERTQMAIEEESSLGSLLSANALNSTTAAAGVQKLKNAFEELQDAIGKVALGPMTEGTKTLLTIIQGLGKEMGKGGPGGSKTNPLSFMEGLELTGMQLVKSMGGAIPESEGFKARYAELTRRLEESFAAGSGKALEAGPAAEDPDVMKKESARQSELGKRFARPGDESALALRVPGEGGPAPAPFGGLTDIVGKFDGAMEGATRAADVEATRQAERGEMLQPPSGFEPLPFEQASEFARGFRDPADIKDAKARAKEEAAAERAERKRTFQSQAFSDPADFARSFITDMLSGKDDTPKKHLTVAERSLTVMEDIAEALTPTFGQQTSHGPMIMRGASSPP